MAERDPVKGAALTPIAIDQRLRERVTEAVVAQGGFRHEKLNAFLRARLGGRDVERGALFSEPIIEGAAGYRSSGKTPADLVDEPLHPELVRALTDRAGGDDYCFDHPAYDHQLRAWRLLIGEMPKSVLISSGTGSGKTECFLVPLLDDLARETALKGRLTGVRAVILYPLNALIASQEERLTRWTRPFKGKIRFALYNGLMQDKRKSQRDRVEAEVPEQVLYRTTLRADPPPILVTNNTMLEYLTIRKEDHPIIERSRGLLRWIIIDEAHSYVGSAAAEVSLLLRRVLLTFGVSAADVRFVATSATIGGSGESAKADLRRYLADLAGVPAAQVHVVTGDRQEVALPPRGESTSLSPGGLADTETLACHPAVQDLVREAERGPVTLGRVASFADRLDVSATALIEAIAEKRQWVERGEPASLLPLRVHKFVRAVAGLWSCLNPQCTGDRPEDWPFGAVMFQRGERCPHCQAPAFELLACRECGEPWLNAFDHGDRLAPAAVPLDGDEFATASAREDDGAIDEDEETQTVHAAPHAAAAADRRLIATRPLSGLGEVSLDKKTGCLPDRRQEPFVWLSAPVDAIEAACPHCRAAPSALSPSPLWPFRFGAPFLVQNAAPTVLDGVSPHTRRDIALPAQGRQLLSFTDSRQGTARFAANIETMSERSYVRAFVYHMVQKAIPAAIDLGERAKLAEIVATLRDQPILQGLLEEAEAKLAGLGRAEPVPWPRAVKALSDDPMVEQWIRAVWEERDERYHRDPEAFARFLLLRELARRPRRANAIETLGLAKLLFPAIETLAESRVPDLLKRKGRSLDEWKAFLYYLVDSPLRSDFVLNFSRDDARWLLPRKAFLRHVVGPHEPKGASSDLTWPMARPDGPKRNAILLLEQALGVSSADGEDRAAMNDALEAAWTQLRPLLEGPGSTYALDFERAAIAPVDQAWLCPVTHRVLPRLVFGRTPYGIRGNRPGATDTPPPLCFPTLPETLPTTAEQQARLADFVEADPVVSALRQRGVWRDIHDRAAAFAPYIRAEEHSAQQPPWRLRGFETEFKRGEINILACSTTMEMGVDIGSVEAVLNTNVPPSIANYRQRVGRAGRRGQSFSSSLTLARDSALDREAFRDPAKYLRREIKSPRVSLDSARIVQRHANGLLLARWLRQAAGQLTKIKTGEFFGFPQSLTLAPEPDSPVARFAQWLRDPSTEAASAEPLATLVAGTALEGRPAILHRTAAMFEEAAAAFGAQWLALRAQADTVSADARTGIGYQVQRMCREPLLKELANRSLLPGHGFPTGVVQFINDCRETRDRQRIRSDEEPEANRNRRYDYPSRNADIAIREYAPGAEVVIDGLVWSSAGVTLNWQRPAHDEAAREIQSIRTFWQCPDCSDTGCVRGAWLARCPSCGSTAIDQSRFLEPAGFRVDWSASPHAETDRVDYIEAEPARISARGAAWEPLIDPALGRARATSDGLVFHMSRGPRRKGYFVCLDCGRAQADGDGDLRDHDALIPSAGGPGRCSGNDKTYAVTDPLALGYEVLTDVAELQPASITDEGAAWAMVSALREALSRRLGIEPRELGLGAERRRGTLGQATYSLFLFDQSSGGAGYAPRLFDDLAGLLLDAQVILACPEDCETACSACVLAADLYAQQEILNRRAALDIVTDLVAALAEPRPDDVAAPGAALSPPAADALSRRMRTSDVLWLYAPDSVDIAKLDGPPLSGLVVQARRLGLDLRLAIPASQFDQMDDATWRGLRNASLRMGFTIWTADPDRGANGAALIAAIGSGSNRDGFYTRDRDAQQLGSSWGIGLEHPIVVAALADLPEAAPVPDDALERSPRANHRVRIIDADPSRSIASFGEAFVDDLLAEELKMAGAWRPGELVRLSYSDRYLKSPLPVVLMFRTLAALRASLAAESVHVPLAISTEPLGGSRYRDSPTQLDNNWKNESDRTETIQSLARLFGFADCAYSNLRPPHGRKLTMGYRNGSDVTVLFDQGFGYWRAGMQKAHDFCASAEAQASALFNNAAAVAGHGESYFAISRSGT